MHRFLWVFAIVAACGNPSATPDAAVDAVPVDAPVTPVFRNPVNLPDDQLAQQALAILAPTSPAQECNSCHGMTRQRISYWRALSDTAMTNCITDLSLATQESAQKTIDCIRAMPTVPTSDFTVKNLGVYATAVRLPWFKFAFWRAYGDAGDAQYTAFQDAVAMPKTGDAPQLTQEQFDIVAEWFARGVPMLDDTLPTDPAPSMCTDGISSDVAAHVSAMATTGWRAVNRQNMMAMYGCGTETDPKNCLQAIPLASSTAFGATWDLPGHGTWRVLKDETYVTSYWTRSSPDGRFVGQGVANVPGSYILDLQRDATVTINTQYDPAFFPDNSGFAFQGSGQSGGNNNVCAISVLTSNPTNITMTEAACASAGTLGLYEHVGKALGGGDYFGIDSQFESDDGGKSPTLRDPAADFTAMGYVDFTPMIFNGTKFVPKARVRVDTPFEGDSSLSPSAKLVMTRVAGPGSKQLGYVLRKVVATPSGSTYTISAPEIARYCLSGGKPGFSYDERWIAFHHYVTNTNADAQALGFTGTSDPGFTPYKTQGAANIYLMDLRTGVPVRITNMAPGQYALFPHFRSDGWIYAQVRDTVADHEYTIASDAALLAE
ncbi:MAG: hypothetical protein HOV81_39295 [Kofleriaceae bacterium]|nr:hypothetical protein [Kofleriaceae bacterium]